MVNFDKRPDAPASLVLRRSYREQDVIDALCEDFHNKCYICGQKGCSSINVEHFEEHRGNDDLKYDWNNLFWVCTHCNNTKNNTFPRANSNLLNCTNSNHLVDYWIKYYLKYDELIAHVEISINGNVEIPQYLQSQTENTIKLLDYVFSGRNTPIRKTEAQNLVRFHLQPEINKFMNILDDYRRASDENRPVLHAAIQQQLSNESPFSAFKKWIIRDNYPDCHFEL